MNLHNEIMNIPTRVGTYNDEYCYKLGHRDARHAAAELSIKAQARIEELEKALCKAREDINWMLNSQKFLNSFVFEYIDTALNK